jgi:hypothetical protein
MPKISFLITDEDNEKLLEISKKFRLGKSDQVRRGIRMLHDYLIKDIEQPTTAEIAEIKEKDAKQGDKG